MLPGILLVAALTLGIEYGWEPLPEGGMKYIVQFDPAALEEARQADIELESNVPSDVGDVRSISIRLGTGQLPRKSSPPKSELEFPASERERTKSAGTAQADLAAKPQLMLSPQGKPLATQAGFNEPKEESKTVKESKAAAPPSAPELAKPWPLIGALILLFASLGGNVYLLWIFAELRKRHRALLAG
ncbi:MAG: hypothetical protein IT426_16710 [Pirellulales bacterium]|nr:hypothetical protein [Pirellulales bacterium]